ncbi:hypothetical protein CMI41_02215 [Candidatus Pacearchaeota archaeon]|nr:hypothetical protein [Candidatus Pacearchaeota archaeon]|tara:strand:+ start:2497 stop:2805 length:309 start_codon:yes stop_codon:yes gene_type:complete
MEKQFLVNIHKAYRWVIAICDKDLAGQKIEEGEKQLDLTGNFFKGEEKTEEELKEIIQDCIREDSTFNLVGEKSCKVAREINLVEKEGILKIKDIPYALVLL